MLEKKGTTKITVLGVTMQKKESPSDEKDALYLAAFEREDMARVYFAKLKKELSERRFGYRRVLVRTKRQRLGC